MADLELKRTRDRRLYALEGVGTLRLEGLGGHTAIAEAADASSAAGGAAAAGA